MQGIPITETAKPDRSPWPNARCAARLAFCVAAGLSARGAPAAEWNGYATFASDYIFRGVSLVDGLASVQLGVEGRFNDVFVAGAWAGNVTRQWLYDQPVPGHLELNVYAGTDFACGSICRARFIVTGYEYPGPGAHDWAEATGSIALFERVGASYSWSPHGFGTGNATRTAEAWYVQPLARATSLGVDGGKIWIGPFDYWFARAGLSQRVDRWVFDLSHYWSDPKFRQYGFDSHSQRWVISVSTAF